MDINKKLNIKDAKTVLEYWKIIEFLTQENYGQSFDFNKKKYEERIKKVKDC